MTRKEFLKHGAALGLGLPFLSLLLEACEKDEVMYEVFDVNFRGKVLVVGAGAAGLMAGYLLDRYNIDFEILEASRDFGGRVKRADGFADFPIDLGAEWIHEDPKVLAELISNASIDGNIDVIPYSPDTMYSWSNGRLQKLNWAANYYSEYKFKRTTWYGFFENYFVPNIGDRILYNRPVVEINYAADQVIVTDAEGDSYEADKVLVTVPTAILKSGSITFTPALPREKADALNNMYMPDGIKVFVEFSKRFYPDFVMANGLQLEDLEERVFYDAAFRKDSDRHVLGLFTIGSSASAYTELETEQEIIDAVIRDLDEMFDGQASRYYRNHVIQNWSKEPHIQGAYTFHSNGPESDNITSMLKSLESKVYFAGEALSRDNAATVPGASQSAYSVIKTMLKASA